MGKLTKEAEDILYGRFGNDCLIALATIGKGIPYVRTVDAYYCDSAFYVLTHALSGKMRQIAQDPAVAIAADWFTAHGIARDLGWFCEESNRDTAARMRRLFAKWIDNGHNDFSDRNICILRIDLTDGILFSQGIRYDIDFIK